LTRLIRALDCQGKASIAQNGRHATQAQPQHSLARHLLACVVLYVRNRFASRGEVKLKTAAGCRSAVAWQLEVYQGEGSSGSKSYRDNAPRLPNASRFGHLSVLFLTPR
jgi:hypothetical protein